MGCQKNNDIQNKKGTSYAEKLVIEGFYNHKGRRRIPIKRLYGLLIDGELEQLKTENAKLKKRLGEALHISHEGRH